MRILVKFFDTIYVAEGLPHLNWQKKAFGKRVHDYCSDIDHRGSTTSSNHNFQ